MKKILGFGLMTTALMGLAACGSSNKQAAANETSNAGLLSAASLDNVTYNSDCTNVPFDILHLNAYKVSYAFHGTIDKTTTYYSDNACQQNVVLVVDESGTFTPHDNVNGDTLTVRTDIVFTKVTVTPKQDDITNAMNKLPSLPGTNGGFCGAQDWSNGKANDITSDFGALNCVGLGQGKIGVTSYDIVNTANGQLHFGLASPGHDKSTPAQRPTAVDPTVLGTK